MVDGKVVHLFGSGVHVAPPTPSNRDLFGSMQEARDKVVFLDEADWQEESLLRVMARNPVAAVVDMRSRPVFRLPYYRHRYVISYFYRHRILYIEMASLSREGSAGTEDVRANLATVLSERAKYGLTICIYDKETKERGRLDYFKALAKLAMNGFVELHPRALEGATFPGRSER